MLLWATGVAIRVVTAEYCTHSRWQAASPESVELATVGIGVACAMSIAVLAASHALRTRLTGGTLWVLHEPEQCSLIADRPSSVLLPILRVDEWCTLCSEGITTCTDLVHLGGPVLHLRFGPERAQRLVHAATHVLLVTAGIELNGEHVIDAVPKTNCADNSNPYQGNVGAASCNIRRASPSRTALPEPGTGRDNEENSNGYPRDKEQYLLPSCSQVSPETIAEIGGDVGTVLRQQYALARGSHAGEHVSEALMQPVEFTNHGAFAASRMVSGTLMTGTGNESTVAGTGWTCEACTYEHVEPIECHFLTCKLCRTQRNPSSMAASVTPVLALRPREGRTLGTQFRNSAPVSVIGGRPASERSATLGYAGGGNLNAVVHHTNGHPNQSETDSAVSSNFQHSQGRNPVDLSCAIEYWDDVRPHILEWIIREQAPDADPLLMYARNLVATARLDELGRLSQYLERVCLDQPKYQTLLQTFAEEVDSLVQQKYGGRFEPLRGIWLALTPEGG